MTPDGPLVTPGGGFVLYMSMPSRNLDTIISLSCVCFLGSLCLRLLSVSWVGVLPPRYPLCGNCLYRSVLRSQETYEVGDRSTADASCRPAHASQQGRTNKAPATVPEQVDLKLSESCKVESIGRRRTWGPRRHHDTGFRTEVIENRGDHCTEMRPRNRVRHVAPFWGPRDCARINRGAGKWTLVRVRGCRDQAESSWRWWFFLCGSSGFGADVLASEQGRNSSAVFL